MVSSPELEKQNLTQQQSPENEWGELVSLIEGLADPEYITALHESRKSDENFIMEFRQVLDTVTPVESDIETTEEAEAIKSFFTEKLQSGEDLSLQQMATVLYELKDRGDDSGVVEVFEAGVPFGLDESAVLKEFYAVSLNKVGRTEDSIDILGGLLKNDNARVGEVSGILGKAYKLRSKEALDEQQRVEYMQQSVSALEEGFYATYEFYPGINLVYNQIELASMTDNPALIDKAFNDAELVMYAAKKAGAERTSDFWTAATLLESSIFAGEVTAQMVEHCLETSENDWELEATIGNIRGVANTITDQLASGEQDEATYERLRQIVDTINGTEEAPGVLAILEAGGYEASIESAPTSNDSIIENGFMYGETTTLIGGNIEFGGQLQAHIVNRFDVKVAHSVMEHFELDSIGTIEEFNDAVDNIIRSQFGTSELEDLHGEAHEIYDAQMKNLLDSLGINTEVDKSSVDSRTNVMVDFLLGKGDCRQHAHAKQLMFDSWKTFKLNNLISTLKDAHETPDTADDDAARKQIQELLRTQMMVFDSVVESRIQMNNLYNPKLRDGLLIESDEFEPVEDHTWNGIISFDENGHVASIEMADSFYQEEYGFGGRGQVITETDSYSGEGLIVTELSAVSEDGTVKQVPVRLKPTPYAGSRGKRMLTHTDIGAAHLRGVDLGYDMPQVADVFSSLKVKEFWEQMATQKLAKVS